MNKEIIDKIIKIILYINNDKKIFEYIWNILLKDLLIKYINNIILSITNTVIFTNIRWNKFPFDISINDYNINIKLINKIIIETNITNINIKQFNIILKIHFIDDFIVLNINKICDILIDTFLFDIIDTRVNKLFKNIINKYNNYDIILNDVPDDIIYITLFNIDCKIVYKNKEYPKQKITKIYFNKNKAKYYNEDTVIKFYKNNELIKSFDLIDINHFILLTMKKYEYISISKNKKIQKNLLLNIQSDNKCYLKININNDIKLITVDKNIDVSFDVLEYNINYNFKISILNIETFHKEEYNFFDILQINESINFPKENPICKIKFKYHTYPPHIFKLNDIIYDVNTKGFIKKNLYNHKIKLKYNNIYLKDEINNFRDFEFYYPIENNNYNLFINLYDKNLFFKKNIGKIMINLINNTLNNIKYIFDNNSLQIKSNIHFYPFHIIKIDMLYVKIKNNISNDYLSKSDLFFNVKINNIHQKTNIINNSDESKWIFKDDEMEFYLLYSDNTIIELYEKDIYKEKLLGSIELTFDDIVNSRKTNIINKSIDKIADISVKIFYNGYI